MVSPELAGRLLDAIRRKREELQQRRAIRSYIKNTECATCDLAVASGMMAQCYRDISRGETMRDRYRDGEITLRELRDGMDPSHKNYPYVYDFVTEQFRAILDTRATQFTEDDHA
ncbi:MAG: hypothetical protein PHU95_00725 [Candidatus Thermoplasmatota archaeon]|nr:hypothetical protein [Candidatus Thermoplasmatota archaeon]MDD5777961.1 hypothetical protein [Candidatus Thermoplasmatota archaeon]